MAELIQKIVDFILGIVDRIKALVAEIRSKNDVR